MSLGTYLTHLVGLVSIMRTEGLNLIQKLKLQIFRANHKSKKISFLKIFRFFDQERKSAEEAKFFQICDSKLWRNFSHSSVDF